MINMTTSIIKTLCTKFVASLHVQNEYYKCFKGLIKYKGSQG